MASSTSSPENERPRCDVLPLLSRPLRCPAPGRPGGRPRAPTAALPPMPLALPRRSRAGAWTVGTPGRRRRSRGPGIPTLGPVAPSAGLRARTRWTSPRPFRAGGAADCRRARSPLGLPRPERRRRPGGGRPGGGDRRQQRPGGRRRHRPPDLGQVKVCPRYDPDPAGPGGGHRHRPPGRGRLMAWPRSRTAAGFGPRPGSSWFPGRAASPAVPGAARRPHPRPQKPRLAPRTPWNPSRPTVGPPDWRVAASGF